MYRFFFDIKMIGLAVLVALLASCNSLSKSEWLYSKGRYSAVVQAVTTPDGPSKAVQGNLYRVSGFLMDANFPEGLAAIQAAEKGIQVQDASINLLNYYWARGYDALMLETYHPLLYLLQGDANRARVAFNCLETTQKKVIAQNQRFIAKAEEKLQRAKQELNNPQLERNIAKEMSVFQAKQKVLQARWRPYKDYQSPVGHFLSGLFRLWWQNDPQDPGKARTAFGAVNVAVSGRTLQILREVAERNVQGNLDRRELNNQVVVLFENGLGAIKVERRYHLLIPWQGGSFCSFDLALPELKERDRAFPCLDLFGAGAFLGRTEELCSIDRLVARAFEDELHGIVIREFAEGTLKLAAQIGAVQATRKKFGDFAAFLVGCFGSSLSAKIAHADVRGWNLLPKEYQVAIISRPTDGNLSIIAQGRNIVQVELPAGPALVYVKIPRADLAPLVAVTGPGLQK